MTSEPQMLEGQSKALKMQIFA